MLNAWFANNNSVKATGMEVNAVADDSLVIKGAAESNYTSVGTNTLTGVNGGKLSPTTSFDGENFAILSDTVQVKDSTSAAATWSGTSGAFQASDLTTLSSNQSKYYLTSTYSIAALGTQTDVYVSGIELTNSTGVVEKAVRVAVTIDGTTYVYNAGGGTNRDEGVVTGAVGNLNVDAWELKTASYKAFTDKTAKWTLPATSKEESYSGAKDVTVKVWFEGQDTNCYSDAIDATGTNITITFSKAV